VTTQLNGEARAAGLPAPRPYTKLLESELSGATLIVSRSEVLATDRERYDWSVTVPGAADSRRIIECGSLFADRTDEDAERRATKRGRAALRSTADRIEAGHE
jgi:hypothetical protein